MNNVQLTLCYVALKNFTKTTYLANSEIKVIKLLKYGLCDMAHSEQ